MIIGGVGLSYIVVAVLDAIVAAIRTGDYRIKIIMDWDSPILAFKANRDRYTNPPNRYAGLPYLGDSQSEDAITWNVFRSLQKASRLDIITSKLEIGEPRGLLLWAVAPELDSNNAKLQYMTGRLMRKFDGMLPGQIAGPELQTGNQRRPFADSEIMLDKARGYTKV